MSEEFYQLYKSIRDMVEYSRHAKLSENAREFVDAEESICNNYDKRNSDCYNRWQKEFNNKIEDF